MPERVSNQEATLEAGCRTGEIPLGTRHGWICIHVTDPLALSQNVILELKAKNILGFGDIADADGWLAQRPL